MFGVLNKLFWLIRKFDLVFNRPISVSAVVKDIGAGSLGFDSQAGQIGHCVANYSPPLRDFFGAVLPGR